MDQKMTDLAEAAKLIATHHDVTTGEALDLLIRVSGLLQRGETSSQIAERLG